MLSRQRLFWRLRPYDVPGSDRAFLRACRENCAYHIRRCPGYAAICEHLGFSPDQLRTVDDLAQIPPIPTLFFKGRTLFSMPRRRMAMEVTSSGTSGKFSRIGFDWGSILAEAPMVVNLGLRHHLASPKPAHCVILGYKPHRSNHTGVTRTMFGLSHFSPPLSRTYALRMEGEGYVPDLDAVARALKKLERSHFPTRIIGFPSYLWFGLKRMEELGLRVKLPPASFWPEAGRGTPTRRWTSPPFMLWQKKRWASRRTTSTSSLGRWSTRCSTTPAPATISTYRPMAGSSSGTRTPWPLCPWDR